MNEAQLLLERAQQFLLSYVIKASNREKFTLLCTKEQSAKDIHAKMKKGEEFSIGQSYISDHETLDDLRSEILECPWPGVYFVIQNRKVIEIGTFGSKV